MFEQTSQDRVAVKFTGAEAGTEPLTWGQKAILQDMRDSGNQFTMAGMVPLSDGRTVADAAARLSKIMGRHAAMRMRLGTDGAGRPCQEVTASGQTSLDILTLPDDFDRAAVEGYVYDLMDTWPLTWFDFHHDWPLRMAVIRHRGECRYLTWILSHLATDGGGHILMLGDFHPESLNGRPPGDPGTQILDVARSEQTPQVRQLSSRAMRYWESALRNIPAQTFGGHIPPAVGTAPLHWHARFSSPATHLATLAIARRTGIDVSRVTLAIIATSIGRVTGINPLTIKVTVNNRFRRGLTDVIAPVSQVSVISVDLANSSVDEVAARTRGASLTAGMRAYYDPDDLAELTARLDAERGYPARVTCRVNDQRAMVMREQDAAGIGEVTREQVTQRLPETALTWLGRKPNMYEQVNILIENKQDVVSLNMMWDLSCLSTGQVEAILRGVEEIAVEAAFDPDARTRVS